MNYDCESRGYGRHMAKWLLSLEVFDATKHIVSDMFYSLKTTLPPLNNLSITIAKINGKRAVIFTTPEQLEYGILSIDLVYFPETIEVGGHDYDDNGKYMFSARIDDKFWIYEEKFRGGYSISNFGMDMTMPFLEQQKFRIL